jgi:hypothetical protein
MHVFGFAATYTNNFCPLGVRTHIGVCRLFHDNLVLGLLCLNLKMRPIKEVISRGPILKRNCDTFRLIQNMEYVNSSLWHSYLCFAYKKATIRKIVKDEPILVIYNRGNEIGKQHKITPGPK